MDDLSDEHSVPVDQASAISGVQAAKIGAALQLARPLLGHYQEQAHDLPLALASARGQFVTAEQILRFYLAAAGDLELELLCPSAEIDTLAVALGGLADYIDSPEFRPPVELFGDQTNEIVASIASELGHRAVVLLSTRRPLTPDLPGSITYLLDDDR